nr:MAG TPA_asm: hypothetical protein [Caudoviricetes sp.]
MHPIRPTIFFRTNNIYILNVPTDVHHFQI